MTQNNRSIKFQQALKRVFDLSVSAIGLVLLSPFLAGAAIAVMLDSKGPAFYRQQRIGFQGKPFKVIKFRTMISGNKDDAYQEYLRKLIASDQNGDTRGLPYRKMKDDSRVTRIGRILRRYYLDELPQLVNIVKGEMSLVGPRPHVQLEVDAYTPAQHRRLSVRPGLTGYWQVEGKLQCSFSELIQLDLDYIDHWSFLLDLKLISKTALLLFPGGEKLLYTIKQRDLKKHRRLPNRPAFGDLDIDTISSQDLGSVDASATGMSTIKRGGISK